MRVEPLELELAYDLIDLVDSSSGGDLLDRVRALRRKLALELGIVIPLVRTRDNLDLPPKTYAIRLHGVEVARGEAPPGMLLAIGDDLASLPGTVSSPAARISRRARSFSPIISIISGVGPMKVISEASQTFAKLAFSERNP